VLRALLGVVAGATIGLVLISLTEMARRAERTRATDYSDFAGAWSALRADVGLPWRVIRRAVRRGDNSVTKRSRG
jgi:hypothetical protein